MEPITKAERRKRLLKLAEFLVTMKLPKRARFDMTTIGEHRGPHAPRARNYCGTAACAAGWAGTLPSFQRAGFRLKWSGDEEVQHADVVYGNDRDAVALMKFFGLTEDEMHHAFGGHRGRTRRQEARLLRELAEAEVSHLTS